MLISQGVRPLWGVKQVRGGENTLFSSKIRQYHSPDGADGCITSNKSLTCLQLTSNWSNFRHAFASRGFVGVSWAFLLTVSQYHFAHQWRRQNFFSWGAKPIPFSPSPFFPSLPFLPLDVGPFRSVPFPPLPLH